MRNCNRPKVEISLVQRYINDILFRLDVGLLAAEIPSIRTPIESNSRTPSTSIPTITSHSPVSYISQDNDCSNPSTPPVQLQQQLELESTDAIYRNEFMTKVIETWLQKRLGLCLNLDSLNLGQKLYNGVIFYKLLENYNVLTDACLPEPSGNVYKDTALVHLLKMSPWFKLLGVSHSREFLEEVASKKHRSCLRLLYELYLKLEDRDNIYFVTKQRESHLLSAPEGRFSVVPTGEPVILSNPLKNSKENLEIPLIENQKLISRYKHLKMMKEKVQEKTKRESLFKRECFEKENSKGPHLNKDQHELKFHKYEKIEQDPIQSFMDRLENQMKNSNDFIQYSPKQQINYLRQKRLTILANEALKLKMQNLIINDSWTGLLAKEKKEFEKAFKQKFFQQSEYEKKFTLRLNQLHNNLQNFSEQKSFVTNVRNNCRGHLIPYDDIFHQKEEQSRLEKARTLELYERLYLNKITIRWQEHYDFCKQIVQAFADIALLISEEEKETNLDISTSTMNDWKEIFFKGMAFFDKQQSSEITVEKNLSNESSLSVSYEIANEGITSEEINQTISLNESESQNGIFSVLSKLHAQCYLDAVGLWTKKDYPELMYETENLAITSHDIHRLLHHKYPLPEVPKPDKIFDNFKIRAILGQIKDQGFIEILSKLLQKPNVAVVEVHQAVNYCLKEYEKEKNLSEFGRTLKVDFDDDYKEQKEILIKEIPSGKLISERVREMDKMEGRTKSLFYVNKTTQYPSTEFILKRSKHSNPALLGKIAFETLNRGEILNDVLVCKIILEYLKTLQQYSGFVLINFPNSAFQAAVLEFLFSGKPLNVNGNMDSSIDLFDVNVVNPPFIVDRRILMDFDHLFNDFVNEKLIELRKELSPLDDTFSQFQNLEEETFQFGYIKKNRVAGATITKDKNPEEGGGKTTLPFITIPLEKEVIETEFITYDDLMRLRTSKILPRVPDVESVETTKTSYFTKFLTNMDDISDEENKIESEYKKIAKEWEKNKMQWVRKMPTGLERCLSFIKWGNPPLPLIPFPSPITLYKKFNIFEYVEPGLDLKAAKRYARAILGERYESALLRKYSDNLFGSDVLESIELGNISAEKKPCLESFVSQSEQTFEINTKTENVSQDDTEKTRLLQPSVVYSSIPFSASRSPRAPLPSSSGEPKPGEPGWKYLNERILPTLQTALASLWESVENSFLSNLYGIMYMLRVHGSMLIPYTNYVHSTAENSNQQTDDRQNIITNFQLMFNQVDNDFRRDPEMKLELYCRIDELNKILRKLVEQKKVSSTIRRQEIVDEDWMSHFIIPMLNLYIQLMQIELDRFIDTVQILCDYYISMLGNMPEISRFEKLKLGKISELLENIEFPDSPKISSDAKVVRKRRHGSTDVPFENKLAASPPRSPTQSLTAVVQPAVGKVKHVHAVIKAMMKDDRFGQELRAKLTPKKKDYGTRIRGGLAAAKSSPSKSRTSRKTTASMNQQLREKRLVKDMDIVEKIKYEWEAAIQNEVNRFLFRLKLIETRAKVEMEEARLKLIGALDDFGTSVSEKYANEILAIENVCSVFLAAIEDETPIQPLLVLNNDKFYIDRSYLMFPDAQPSLLTSIQIPVSQFSFSMEQLDNFVTKMFHISTSAVCEEAFVSMVEDMATYNVDSKQTYIPMIWATLSRENFKTILVKAFGDSGVFDWRDFVIHVANIPYPTFKELLNLKQTFKQNDSSLIETVTYEEYMNIPLWFDVDFANTIEEDLRLALIKELLFKMYQVSPYEMNYSCFLLAFCKSENSIESFLNGLILLDNRSVIKDGDCTTEQILVIDKQKLVGEILNDTLNGILKIAESVTLKTLPPCYHDKNMSDYDDYMASEKLLLENSESPRNPQISNEQINVQQFGEEEEDQEETLPFITCDHPLMKQCIPYDLVLTLLTMVLNYHAFSPEHLHRQIELEKRLSELYEKKGKNGYIKGFDLVYSEILKELFETTKIFKKTDLCAELEMFLAKIDVQPTAPSDQSPDTEKK